MIDEPSKKDLERDAEEDYCFISNDMEDYTLSSFSRRALPAWIKRAVAVEKKVEELKDYLRGRNEARDMGLDVD